MQDNRQIKQILSAVYGRENVRVSSRRGSSYTRVYINRTPLDCDEAEAWRAEARKHLVGAGCDLGTAFTDDDCRYTMDKTMIEFNQARFFRTFKAQDGSVWGQTDRYNTDSWVAAYPHVTTWG